MADRRNIWAALYESAQDPDPATAMAAIKTITSIVARWQNAAMSAAIEQAPARGETTAEAFRRMGDALGDSVYRGKARVMEQRSLKRSRRIGSPPPLTPRQREVLIELCRGATTNTATADEVADLYEKFEMTEGGAFPKRVQLANLALDTGTISLSDLREPE